MEENKKEQRKVYKPSEKESKELSFIYDELDTMISVRNQEYRQFNDRTLIQFVDDSEKRLQGYVPSRDSQDKEEWQSNVFNQATRNKTKALVAAVASNPPKTPIKAFNIATHSLDIQRGEYMEQLVRHARNNQNPEVQIFWEAWEGAGKGTIIKYNGYLKSVQRRKFIKSYNFETGEMTFDEKEVVVNDECVDVFVNLSEFFIKDIFCFDIQDQPAIAWVRYLDRSATELEFGRYPNWKYVHDKNPNRYKGDVESFFLKRYESRVEENEYEVIKYYNKSRDQYSVVINGVLILSVPLLLGLRKKYYPFSKQVFEPFSGRTFFYGNSLPNANMDVQDVINTLYNSSLDKIYRSLVPQKLVGTVNKDLLEMENDEYGMEDTVYVSDVNQVKWLENPGLNNSEMAMIKWVGQQFDLGTVDTTQQGVTGKGVTAREIVIANENAKRIKGIFFTFLSDLWVQKTRLTILNILMHYPLPKIEEIIGEDGTKSVKETYPTFYVQNADFPNGQKGTLAIQFVGSRKELPTRDELDVEEEIMKLKGMNFQKVAMTSNYFLDYEYEPEVVTESLYIQDIAEDQATFLEKLKVMMTAFPEIYARNKKILFEDFVKAYRDKTDRYDLELSPEVAPLPSGSQPSGTNTPQSAIPSMNLPVSNKT